MNERIKHPVPRKKVPDFGCVLVGRTFANEGFQVAGIDILKDFIETDRQKYPLADLRCASFDRFIFSEKEFDTVILRDTIYHIPEEADIDGFWMDIRRVCRDRSLYDHQMTIFET